MLQMLRVVTSPTRASHINLSLLTSYLSPLTSYLSPLTSYLSPLDR